MATGSMAALSALGKVPHEPNMVIRASLAPSPIKSAINVDAAREVAHAIAAPLSDKDIARQAAEAKKELAAASAITEAVTEATRNASAKSGAGFMRLFSSIITAKPDELGLSSDILKFGPMRIKQDLVATIVRAAKETNSDPVLLMAIADKEFELRHRRQRIDVFGRRPVPVRRRHVVQGAARFRRRSWSRA